MTIIRRAENRDIPGMIALLHQVGQVHHDIRPDIFCDRALKYDASALEALLKDPARPIFVAVEENFVQGYCFCIHRDYDGDSVFTQRRELYIDDLCLDERCRGSGIATLLYDHACVYARERSCAFVTLNVWEGNVPARRFYEKCGMTPRSTTMEVKL